MITYEQIQKANEGLSTINMKDKPYVMVPQRVKAFRKLFPEGFITTDLLSNENGVCVMKTEVGYYEGERRVVLGSGFAYEKETNGFVNKTSYLENCETSSVGRALGFLALGIDGGGICSAEELVNAIRNQNVSPSPRRNNSVTATPPAKSQDPVVPNLDEIRSQLDEAIKTRTKDLDRSSKIRFLNEVIQPALHGERNWKLCSDISLLQNLLICVNSKT